MVDCKLAIFVVRSDVNIRLQMNNLVGTKIGLFDLICKLVMLVVVMPEAFEYFHSIIYQYLSCYRSENC